MSPQAVPTFDELMAALRQEGDAHEAMLERLSKLGRQSLDEATCREFLRAAATDGLSVKAQRRLIDVTTPTDGLAADYRALFEQLTVPWLRATILGKLNRLENCAQHFDLVSRMVDGGGVTSSVLPVFRRLRGHWQALLSRALPPFLEPMLAEQLFGALLAKHEAPLSAQEDMLIGAFLGAAALRRLPAVERAQSDEPFFWFNQACSEEAGELTSLFRALGFLQPCGASSEALDRGCQLLDPYASIAAAVSSLRLGRGVAGATVLRLAAFMGTRTELLAELKLAGKAALIPADFAAPAAVMEGEVAAWMASPFELTRVPRELKTIAEREIVLDGSGTLGLVFVMQFEYEPSLWEQFAVPTYVIAGMLPAAQTGCHELWKPCTAASTDEALAAAEQMLRQNTAADAASSAS